MPDGVQVRGDLFHGRIPDGAVYVGRPAPGFQRSRWANPFKYGRPTPLKVRLADQWWNHPFDPQRWPADAAEACDWYRLLIHRHHLAPLVRAELAGHDLACWCKLGHPCHRDVLLDIANSADVTELDGAMFSVWLHTHWKYQTKKMTTGQREAAVAAVLRYHAAHGDPDAPMTREHLVWWD